MTDRKDDQTDWQKHVTETLNKNIAPPVRPLGRKSDAWKTAMYAAEIEQAVHSNLGHAPCPFCGGTDIALVRRADTYPPSHFGMCMGCGAEGPRIDGRFAARHPSGRRYYWQDRPAAPDLLAERDSLRAEVERLREVLLNIADMPANPRYDWYQLVDAMASTARRAALEAQEPTP